MSLPAVAQTPTVAKPTITPVVGGILQLACACGQHTGNGGECEDCKRKRQGMLQRLATDSSPVSEVPAIVHEVLCSPGSLLMYKYVLSWTHDLILAPFDIVYKVKKSQRHWRRVLGNIR